MLDIFKNETSCSFFAKIYSTFMRPSVLHTLSLVVEDGQSVPEKLRPSPDVKQLHSPNIYGFYEGVPRP